MPSGTVRMDRGLIARPDPIPPGRRKIMANENNVPPDEEHAPDDEAGSEPLAPAEQWAAMTFEPLLIDASKFGPEWEQARGAIARMAIALLRFDDRDLTRHFMNHPEPLRRVMDMHAGLQSEIEYLQTHIQVLETAATRLLCVASRCAEQLPPEG
jgi:hypothetical protein